MENIKQKLKSNLNYIFIIISLLFIIPSIIYIILGKNILFLESSFNFFFKKPTAGINCNKLISTVLFYSIFIGLTIVYFAILKNYKNIFKTNKSLFIFIIVVALIFMFMLPTTSTDIFYYLGTGWLEAHYKVNPYYVSIQDVMNQNEVIGTENGDLILLKTPKIWRETTIVYGPMWPIICRILSEISMGNLTAGLFIYKLFNLAIHIINSYLIYKISNKKKLYTLMYAINPLVLFEGLANVHNELVVVFFILMALYFFIKKKQMLPTVVFLALATAIKYYAILLISFLVIYKYRNEKILKRILYAIGWALVFIVVLAIPYLVYVRDISVFKGILVQQGKLTNSIFLIIYLLFNDISIATKMIEFSMIVFIIYYIYKIIKLLINKEKITFTHIMRVYNNILLAFIFFTISNFQSWYIIWLIPTLMWQRGKMSKLVLNISIAVQLGNIAYFILNEHYKYGKYYYIIMILSIFILTKIGNKQHLKIEGKANEKNI